MCVDVGDLFRFCSCLIHGVCHRASRSASILNWRGNVVCVSGCSISYNLRIDLCSSCFRMFQFLQYHDSGSLSQDKPISVFVKWNRCFHRISGRRKSCQRRESCYSGRADRTLRTAREHHFRIPVLDRAERVSNTVGAGSARCHDIGTFSSCSKLNRNISGRHIGDHQRYHQRMNPVRPFLHDLRVFSFHRLQTSDSGAYDNAYTKRIFLFHVDSRILACLHSRRDRILGKWFHSLGCLEIHIVLWLKILDLSRNLYFIVRSIKFGDFTDPYLARFDSFPEFRYAVSNRSNSSQSCYNYSSFHISSPSSLFTFRRLHR